MAVLVGGQTWGLSTSKNRNKSVVLLKLTDSSLRALEDHLQRETLFSSSSETNTSSHQTRKPTIKFQKEFGTITIPLGSDGKEAQFSFSISSNDEAQGPKGSFECLSSNQHGSLESIGVVQEKIHVQASDDTYTRFGEKMVEAKKESEKRTTQFLDRRPPAGASASISARNKYMRQHPQPSQKRSSPAPFTHQHHRDSAISSMKKSRAAPAVSGHLQGHHASSTSSSAPPQQPAAGFLSSTHPMLDRNSKTAPYSRMSHINPELMRRPLKERIIHLLAVRPFKKPELLSRITRDGVLEKDKKNITLILKQVSFMKDNTYHLLRHIWNDVSEDWPFYSEQEKQSFRRRKPQNLTPPCSDGSTSSSGHSPSSTHPASPPPSVPSSSPMKRNYYGAGMMDDNGLAAKKKRVSNYVRPADMQRLPNTYNSPTSGYSDIMSGSLSPGGLKAGNSPGMMYGRSPGSFRGSPVRSPMNRYVIPSHEQQRTPNSMNTTTNKEQSSNYVITEQNNKAYCWTPSPRGDHNNQPQPEQHQQLQPEEAPSSMIEEHQQQQNADNSGGVSRDFELHFTKITNKEQRTRYKKEFNENYTTYRSLHLVLEKVSNKFALLETRLKQEQPGTGPFLKLKSRILKEYTQSKKDKKFIRAKAEFAYLHEKLAHIKKLVHEYDLSITSPKGGSSNPMMANPTLISSS